MGSVNASHHLWYRWVSAHEPATVVEGVEVVVAAVDVRPGDYLPPQRCLDPTGWQDSGFPVGSRARDVSRKFVASRGRVLLCGPLGVLDCLLAAELVSVVRAEDG